MFSNDESSPTASKAAHDVVVVGGSAAGAATALLLARRGLRVALVDNGMPVPAPFPIRPLMRCGVLQMSRWGLLGEITAGGAAPVRRTTFRYGNECTTISLKPSHGIDALYAPSSDMLDCVLARAAIEAGAEMHTRAEVTDVLWRDGRVTGVRMTTSTDGAVDLHAAVVIGADGVDSTIARLVGAEFTREGGQPRSVAYGFWRGLDTDGYEWIYGRDARFAIVPAADDVACVFVAGSPDLLRNGDSAAILDVAVREDSDLAERLLHASATEPGRARTDHRDFIRRSSGPGWALVGDAGCFTDPISPHGFTDALRDAELLAAAVTEGLGGTSSLDAALDRYEATRDGLAVAVFDVVERLAARQDRATIADLLARLTSTMADEVETLAAIQAEVTS